MVPGTKVSVLMIDTLSETIKRKKSTASEEKLEGHTQYSGEHKVEKWKQGQISFAKHVIGALQLSSDNFFIV